MYHLVDFLGGFWVRHIDFRYIYISKGLVTNYGEGGGGATKREGGHVKFYPYEKGGRKEF